MKNELIKPTATDKFTLKPLITLRNLVEDEVEHEFIKSTLAELRAVDIAESLAGFPTESKIVIFDLLEFDQAAEVLSETDEESLKDIIENLTHEQIAGYLNIVAPDDNVDILEIIKTEDKKKYINTLKALDKEVLREIAPLLKYDSDTAGGIMTSDFISVEHNSLIRDAFQKMKKADDDVSIANIYACDNNNFLRGTLSFREIIQADSAEKIYDVMNTNVISVTPDTDQEQAVSLMKKYDLSMLPVISDAGELLGVVTVDDAMDVLAEEAEEDLAIISGSLVYDPLQTSVFRRIWLRLPWLIVSLLGTFITSAILRASQTTIVEIASAVFFIPAITAMSGNVGLQSSTTIIRGLAIGQVNFSMIFRVVSKEVRTAVIIGTLCGILVAIYAFLLGVDENVGWIVGLAMGFSISFSAIVGTVIPLICDKMNIDPAIAAGPFITTLDDSLSIAIYMAIIAVFLT